MAERQTIDQLLPFRHDELLDVSEVGSEESKIFRYVGMKGKRKGQRTLVVRPNLASDPLTIKEKMITNIVRVEVVR